MVGQWALKTAGGKVGQLVVMMAEMLDGKQAVCLVEKTVVR